MASFGISPPQITRWDSKELVDHELVGLIWSESEQRFVTPRTLIHKLRTESLILLGERHDNPDHHRLQGWIVAQVSKSKQWAIGFEMLDENDASQLKPYASALEFAKAVSWDKSGWPPFSVYAPLFESVVKANLTMLAIHPSRARLMKLMRNPKKRSRKDAEKWGKLSEEGLLALREDIRESHCGHANEKVVEAMIMAQRFKDFWMSDQMNRQRAENPGILVAGNGHLRKDYGLPNHFEEAFTSVGIVEVQPKLHKADDYNTKRFDYVWFTPRLDSEDPCEKYKKQLQRIKRHYEKHPPAKSSPKHPSDTRP